MTTQQPLGEIAEIVRGISFPKEAKSLEPRSGDVACLRTTNVQRVVEWDDLWFVPSEHVKRAEQFVQPGDILISTANSYELVGKVALVSAVPRQATLGAFISLIRVRPGVDPRFLYHQLAWGRTQSRIRETASTTTNISNVSTKKLAALQLDVPPLDDQRRIVAELEKQFSRLDEAVANLKRVKANLKRYKAGVLARAAHGGHAARPLTSAALALNEPDGESLRARILESRQRAWAALARGSATYKPPVPPQPPHPSQLPSGWAWTTVEELGLADRPCAYGVLQPGDDQESGVPFVRVGDIADGRVNTADLKKIDPQVAAKYPRTQLEGGELLITLVGTIGRTAIVPAELRGANVARAVGVVPLTPFVDARWVELWFRSPQQLRSLDSQAHEVARKTLNLEDVRRARVALPPRAEQEQIVQDVETCLSFAEAMESDVTVGLSRAEKLRQGVLAAAFASRGEGGRR